MKIGIVCAGDRELAPFLTEIENAKITERAKLRFYEGQLHKKEVVVLFTGVCKVNAAIAAQILIDWFGVTAIINSGTAGGMARNVGLLDVVVSTEVCYHDVSADVLTEFHPWMESVFFAADPELLAKSKSAVARLSLDGNIFFGRMVTGEAFITEDGRQKINEEFAPLTVDMESAAFAHVCYVNRIPFLAIRGVTDTAEHSGVGNFEVNCEKAARKAKEVTVALLDEIE